MEESHRTELVMMSFRHLFVRNERIVSQWERWLFKAAAGDASLTFLCWVAIRISCPSCPPKGSPWTYRILTLIFNCTHGLSCLDSKQKSYKFLVNVTNCSKFWRGEGINMTVEEMTAALYVFCPFSVQSATLETCFTFFCHLWLGAYGSYMAVLPTCCCPSQNRVRMEERWRYYHLGTHFCRSAGKRCAAGIEKDP